MGEGNTYRMEFKNPVKIVDIAENGEAGRFVFYPERLEKVLQDHKHKKVAVLAVSGAFRTGKSFLLSYLVKSLKSRMLDDNTPLKGWFPWQAGSRGVTTGIDVWGEPIPVKLSSGEEIVVLLLDTQGTFSHDSTTKDCTILFALSLLLSSFLIYNVPTRVTNNDLQHLQMWTEYGKVAVQQRTDVPFQKVMFLVRDWPNKKEYNYGIKGGKELINNDMQVKGNQASELSSLREEIKSCFEEISCFLLPHPGLEATENDEFDGRMTDVRCIFKQHFEDLLGLLKKQLTVKKVNGTAVTGENLLRYFKEYASLFTTDEMPEPMSTFMANANVHNSLAVERCVGIYIAEMQMKYSASNPLTAVGIRNVHKEAMSKALNEFSKAKVMGSRILFKTFEGRLQESILDKYTKYHTENDIAYKAAVSRNNTAANECIDFYKMKMEEDLGFLTQLSEQQVYESDARAQKLAKARFKEKRVGREELWTDQFKHLESVMVQEAKTLLKEVSFQKAIKKHENDLFEILKEGYVEPAELTAKHEAVIEAVVKQFKNESTRIEEIAVASNTSSLENRLRKRFPELIANNKPSRSQTLAFYGTRLVTVGSSTWAGAAGGAEIGAIATLNPIGATIGAVAGGVAGAVTGIGLCYKAKH